MTDNEKQTPERITLDLGSVEQLSAKMFDLARSREYQVDGFQILTHAS